MAPVAAVEYEYIALLLRNTKYPGMKARAHAPPLIGAGQGGGSVILLFTNGDTE